MADWPPLKNASFTFDFPIFDADGDLVSGAAGLDSEISRDGAAFNDCTNEAIEIGSSGTYTLTLTATETNVDRFIVITKTSTGGAKTAVNSFHTVTRQIRDLSFPAISGTNNQTEVNNLITVTTRAELTAIPGTSPTLAQMIGYIYEYFKHRKVISQPNGTEIIYRFDASTVLGTATISDNGTEFDKGQQA